jgi:cytochrome c biogenesis protein CcmG/thiol:disulfide interchange protein DsbE
VYGAPETFLVDGNGTILHKRIGPMDEAIWQRDFLPKIVARSGESR